MEGKKLKYARKRVITLMDKSMETRPIIAFAEVYKRGKKASVTSHEVVTYSLSLNIRVTRINIEFYSYEPVGELRAAFRDEMIKAGWSGTAIVDGWYCAIPSPHARKNIWLG